jgi:hypothetical protein
LIFIIDTRRLLPLQQRPRLDDGAPAVPATRRSMPGRRWNMVTRQRTCNPLPSSFSMKRAHLHRTADVSRGEARWELRGDASRRYRHLLECG